MGLFDKLKNAVTGGVPRGMIKRLNAWNSLSIGPRPTAPDAQIFRDDQ